MKIPKIYIASKMHHAPRWREAYSREDIHIVSRWPFLEPSIDSRPSNCRKFWQDDFIDIQTADIIIVYVEEGEKLRGALVEVGVALAFGKFVVVIGDYPDFGTWRFHPQVVCAADFEDAIAMVKRLG